MKKKIFFWYGKFHFRIPLLGSLLHRSSLSDATRLNRQRRFTTGWDFWRQCWLWSWNWRLGEWITSHVGLCSGSRHNTSSSAPGTRGTRGSGWSRRRRSAPRHTMWGSGQRPASMLFIWWWWNIPQVRLGLDFIGMGWRRPYISCCGYVNKKEKKNSWKF